LSACLTGMEMFPFGESAVRVQFGSGIHPDLHRKVKALADLLDRYPFPGMIECVSSYASVTVFYDPMKVRNLNTGGAKGEDRGSSYDKVTSAIEQIAAKTDRLAGAPPRVVEIPVCYGGAFGPDLEVVAEHNKLTTDEVIELHSSGQYLVFLIGFAPGFPFLGGMSERIATPRRSSPRMAIAPGSVGIAGMQTGVYPIQTPGGWQLIGRTPLQLFLPNDNPPSLLQSGDTVRFRPISLKQYEAYMEESQ
jgi:inhibitor of KinA